MRNNPILKTIFDAAAANGVGSSINIENYKNNEIMIDTDGGGNAEMAVKFLISYQKDAPDFSAAQTVDNSFSYVPVKDLDSSTKYAGSTGIGALLNGADIHKAFNVEANNPVWITAVISGYVAGAITIKLKSNDDN